MIVNYDPTIVIYDRSLCYASCDHSFKVQAIVIMICKLHIMIVNYDCKTFIVQAPEVGAGHYEKYDICGFNLGAFLKI